MLAIGLGKETGARTIHQQGTVGLRDYMPIVAKHLLKQSNFVAGFGVVEDGYHAVAQLEGFSADTIVEGDQRLLQRSRELMPSLPVDDIDLLIIDEMGKDISGAGMDTNIIGRWMVEGQPEPESPRIKRIVILDLTPASHGNATTYGLADFMSRRLFDKIDFPITMKNMFTSGFLLRCRMLWSSKAMRRRSRRRSSMPSAATRLNAPMRASCASKITLALESMWVSANIADELNGRAAVSIGESAAELAFAGGTLV